MIDAQINNNQQEEVPSHQHERPQKHSQQWCKAATVLTFSEI